MSPPLHTHPYYKWSTTSTATLQPELCSQAAMQPGSVFAARLQIFCSLARLFAAWGQICSLARLARARLQKSEPGCKPRRGKPRQAASRAAAWLRLAAAWLKNPEPGCKFVNCSLARPRLQIWSQAAAPMPPPRLGLQPGSGCSLAALLIMHVPAQLWQREGHLRGFVLIIVPVARSSG